MFKSEYVKVYGVRITRDSLAIFHKMLHESGADVTKTRNGRYANEETKAQFKMLLKTYDLGNDDGCADGYRRGYSSGGIGGTF